MQRDHNRIDRRGFLKGTAAGIGAAAVGQSIARAENADAAVSAKVDPKDLIWRSKSPSMEYSRLGRTNYMVSRIVQGFSGDEALWRRLLAQGVNYWDTGWGYGGGNHEKSLKPHVSKFRDQLWITSKATGVAGFNKIDEKVVELYRKAMTDFLGEGDGDLLKLHEKAIEKQAKSGEKPDLRPAGKRMAELYLSKLDDSLGRMGIDHVDAYFMHGVEIPWIFDCGEVWEAYETAHKAGKVKHFGFSTHKHHQPVLAAAVEANKRGPWKIDLIMPGVNPESFDKLKTELTALKKQDVGIIAMKTAGIKNRPIDAREEKLKTLTEGKDYNEWERAKLWMLHLTGGVIDACIAATPDTAKMERNLALPGVKLSASAKRELESAVKLEMAGSCNLCGACETNCPENIAVTDMIRYNAYIHQYDEKELARELYTAAGYDPSKVCTNCGHCADACTSGVPITQVLHQLSTALA